MENEEKEYCVIEVVKGCEGECLLINDTRVCGNKPWAGGKVIKTFRVEKQRLLKAIE